MKLWKSLQALSETAQPDGQSFAKGKPAWRAYRLLRTKLWWLTLKVLALFDSNENIFVLPSFWNPKNCSPKHVLTLYPCLDCLSEPDPSAAEVRTGPACHFGWWMQWFDRNEKYSCCVLSDTLNPAWLSCSRTASLYRSLSLLQQRTTSYGRNKVSIGLEPARFCDEHFDYDALRLKFIKTTSKKFWNWITVLFCLNHL